jgi:hypothetical protein
MGNKFVVLSILTGLFQLICVIAIVIGIAALSDRQTGLSPSNSFALLDPGVRFIGGAVLVLYGLTGLVFSGGINVLISINENTNAMGEKLASAIAALQRANAAPSPVSAPHPGQTQPAVPVVVEHQASKPVLATTVDPVCSNCGVSNDPDGKFCEYCGNPLSPD